MSGVKKIISIKNVHRALAKQNPIEVRGTVVSPLTTDFIDTTSTKNVTQQVQASNTNCSHFFIDHISEFELDI
jgi:hypothetical protein